MYLARLQSNDRQAYAGEERFASLQLIPARVIGAGSHEYKEYSWLVSGNWNGQIVDSLLRTASCCVPHGASTT